MESFSQHKIGCTKIKIRAHTTERDNEWHSFYTRVHFIRTQIIVKVFGSVFELKGSELFSYLIAIYRGRQ